MRATLSQAVVFVVASVVFTAIAWAEERPANDYPLKYPVADAFCVPIAGFFAEVERTMDRVGTHTFRHQPNGGYGLAVQDMADGKHLLHLGADVGWYRVGEPVCAIANGVVRVSEGENQDVKENRVGNRQGEDGAGPSTDKAPSPRPSPKGRGSGKQLAWGNVVAVEHRLADGSYVTSVYGHLDNDRRVKVGDIVTAGQTLGVIGNTRVNGGYKPHLHLGLREGRMANVGRKLVLMSPEGKGRMLSVAEVRENTIVLDSDQELPDRITAGLDGRVFELTKRDGKSEVAAAFLRYLPSPEFAIVGYGLSTDGWTDPIAFLKTHEAAEAPAVFESVGEGAKRGRARRAE